MDETGKVFTFNPRPIAFMKAVEITDTANRGTMMKSVDLVLRNSSQTRA
jgi:hypothetical protein